MKIINIFLASSIDEFKNERNEIQCFINDVAEDFRDRYDTDIRVQRCEKVDPRYVKGRSQDEFNELIKNSEMCIFLFFTKAGEYTIEEFEVARKAFESSENGKPKIYTYFKTIDNISIEKSVTDFMSELDKNLKHFYQTFSHIDTVKLRILLNLKIQEMDFVSVEFDNGKCIVDGKETLDLSNVSEFANNGVLKQLNDEFLSINKKYLEMKPIYATGNADESFCKKYAKIATKRQSLIDTIEELQKSIFNMSLRMCKDDVHGEITQRQKEAYRLFELGDLDGCMSVLDSKDIDNDFLRAEKQFEEMAKKNAKKYIREHKTAIDILRTMINYQNRFNEIEERYKKIVPVAEKYLIELDIVYDFASFLYLQRKYKAAVNVAENLKDIYSNVNKTEEKQIILYILLSAIYSESYDGHEKEIEYQNKVVDFFNDVKNINKNTELKGIIYNNVAKIFESQGKLENARELLIESVTFLKDSKVLRRQLLTAYRTLGLISKKQYNYQDYEMYFKLAKEIANNLFSEDSNKYIDLYAENCCDISNLYAYLKQPELALEYSENACNKYLILLRQNPERFSKAWANALEDKANILMDIKMYKEALKLYHLVCETRETFIDKNTIMSYSVFEIACSYSNLGCCYMHLKDYSKAHDYFNNAYSMRELMYKKNPIRYAKDYIEILIHFGELYAEINNFDKSQKFLTKAVSISYNMYQDTFHFQYAFLYSQATEKLGVLYSGYEHLYSKAEKLFSDAIQLLEEEKSIDCKEQKAILHLELCKIRIIKKLPEEALDSVVKANEVFCEIYKNKTNGMTPNAILNTIISLYLTGRVYKSLEKYELSYDHLYRAIDMLEELIEIFEQNEVDCFEYLEQLALYYGTLALVCSELDQYSEAVDNLNSSIKVYKKIQDLYSDVLDEHKLLREIMFCKNNIVMLLVENEGFAKHQNMLMELISDYEILNKNNEYNKILASNYVFLAIYLDDDLEMAKKYIKKAIVLIEKIKHDDEEIYFPLLAQYYRLFASLYKKRYYIMKYTCKALSYAYAYPNNTTCREIISSYKKLLKK